MISRFLLLLLSLLLLHGCIHTLNPIQEKTPAVAEEETLKEPEDIAVTDPVDPAPASDPDLFAEALPYLEHPLVKKWIKYFTVKEFERFQRFLHRGEYYRDYIQTELDKHDLPQELYYLAMIESGFRNKARSRARATGIWQFMRGTGRHYGLLIDNYVDQRMDPVASTAAAISYLQDLHRVYQSWWLAIASYNSGEVRVLRAIMKRNTRDFFELIEKKVLPRETINYVPKFIAAMYIARNYQEFGFTLTEGKKFATHEFQIYQTPPRLYLREIASQLNCAVPQIKKHNPAIKHSLIHPHKKIALRLPQICRPIDTVKDKTFTRKSKKRLLAWRKRKIKGKYKIRSGDSLYSVAKRFNTSIKALMLANNLHTSRIYPGQFLHITAKANSQKVSETKNGVIRYRVRRGDNLYRIAKMYNTSVRSIKRVNNMTKSNIYPGQIIKISFL